MEDRGVRNKSLSRWASRRNTKNGVSTDEELVSQNAHHFVEVAADVVDISDVKASSFQAFVLGKDLRWEQALSMALDLRIAAQASKGQAARVGREKLKLTGQICLNHNFSLSAL